MTMPLSKQQRIALILTVVSVVAVLVSAGGVLLPFVFAVLLALLLHPLHRRLRVLGLGAGVSASISTAMATLCVLGLLFGAVPFFAEDALALGQAVLRDIVWLVEWLDGQWGEWFPGSSLFCRMSEQDGTECEPSLEAIAPTLSGIAGAGGAIAYGIFLSFLIPIALFFFLKEGRSFVDALVALCPRCYQGDARDFLLTVGAGLSNYLRGQGIVCAWQAVFHAVLLTVIGLQYGVVIGILTGIAAVIPILGNLTMFFIAMVVAITQFDNWLLVAAVVAVFAAANVLDSFFLVPFFIGRRIALHPLLMIVAVILGGKLFGLVGALLALPGIAVVVSGGRWFWSRYRNTPVYAGDTEGDVLRSASTAK
ncbi:MAG: AI-2E family transporter [Rhodospirillales bacterium]|nr:MAG: AI-2E family transporter [Rhodospirillales bacterium]